MVGHEFHQSTLVYRKSERNLFVIAGLPNALVRRSRAPKGWSPAVPAKHPAGYGRHILSRCTEPKVEVSPIRPSTARRPMRIVALNAHSLRAQDLFESCYRGKCGQAGSTRVRGRGHIFQYDPETAEIADRLDFVNVLCSA